MVVYCILSVSRLVRDQEVASSNLVTPTIKKRQVSYIGICLLIFNLIINRVLCIQINSLKSNPPLPAYDQKDICHSMYQIKRHAV